MSGSRKSPSQYHISASVLVPQLYWVRNSNQLTFSAVRVRVSS